MGRDAVENRRGKMGRDGEERQQEHEKRLKEQRKIREERNTSYGLKVQKDSENFEETS